MGTHLPTQTTSLNTSMKKNEGYIIWTFFSGSPAYLTENINLLKSIANGSHYKLHSLSWKDEIVGMDMEQMIEQAALAEVVHSNCWSHILECF